jgi:hypothetical protein
MTVDELIRFEAACIAAGRFTLAQRARRRRYRLYGDLTQRTAPGEPYTQAGTHHHNSQANGQVTRGWSI